jgi:glycosyltransferase involved in cell wall biosynthesis
VEPDSAEALATGIRAVLKDTDLAKSVAAQAFQDVQEHTWEKRASNILSHYKIM